MKRFAALLSLLLLVPQPAAAQDGSAATEKEASAIFWKFASCIVNRYPDETRKLLAKPGWQVGDRDWARALGQRSIDPNFDRKEPCGYFETMKYDSELFRGTLAGAMFLKDTKRGRLPDYRPVPSPVSAADLAAATDGAAQFRLGLQAFSYCVFLNKPDDVRALLESRPFSDAEHQLFGSLATTFGGCLPAKEGTSITFSHVKLRSLLGEAAYYADSNLSSHALAGKTQ